MTGKIRGILKRLEPHINRVLGWAGFRLVPREKPPRSFSDFCEHLKRKGFRPSLVIDVGVADGTPQLYSAFQEDEFLLVEPLREFEPNLKKLCSRMNAKYVIAAAAETRGTTKIHVHDDLAGSSVLGEVEGDLADGMARQVDTVVLDDLIPEDTRENIFLKIDVQGAELRVLNGIEKNFHKIGVVLAEVALISSMEGGPELTDVIDYMKSKGFCVYDILGGNCRPLDGSLKHIDLAFVPVSSPLRSDRRYATPEQRRALNENARRRWAGLVR